MLERSHPAWQGVGRMLVLNRKTGQRIVIAGGVVVTILDVRGGRVRIGVDAPLAVGIRRAELPVRDAVVGVAPHTAMPALPMKSTGIVEGFLAARPECRPPFTQPYRAYRADSRQFQSEQRSLP
ncbi:MAG: carbon storage regulator [Pirellulaceae bacterium]